MATVEELVVTLTAETSQLRADLKGAQVSLEKSTQSMTKAIDGFSKDASKSTSTFQTAWATMIGFVGGQLAIRSIDSAIGIFKGLFTTLIVDGVSAASDTQVALNSLLNSISRSGQSATGAKKEFEEFAGAIQNTTRFGDDAALSAASLIENLTRLDRDGLKKATLASTDLAAALNLDLNTAAQLVGKAIEGNVGALSRYGIKVEEGRTKAETFSNVMAALNGRFSGAAAAQLQTYAGATTALGNTWADFTKVFGNAVVENKAFINVINTIKNVISEFTASLDPKQIAMFFGEILVGAVNVAGGLTAVISGVTTMSRTVIDVVESIGVAYGAAAAAALAAATGNFSGAADIISSAAKQISDDFADNSTNVALDAISEKLAEVKGAAVSGLSAVEMGLTATVEPANNTSAALDGIIERLTASQEAAKSFAESLIASTATSQEQMNLELEALTLARDQKIITEDEYWKQKLELIAAKQAEEQALLAEGLALTSESKAEAEKAKTILEMQQSNESKKVAVDQTKSKEKEEKLRESNFSASLGVIAGLADSNNKTLAAIGKAAAISQATIDGFAAVQKALAAAPPPFNFALAGLVGVATAANIAKIAGVPLASGIDSVPGIGSRDNFPAILAPGERVVPRETNQDLTRFLDGGSAGGNQITVNVVMNDVFTSDPRDLGLRIINTINETAQASGIKILSGAVQ